MNILILTATIRPPKNAPLLARSDPVLRLQDYSAALAFYLGLLGKVIDYIVFAENSNSSIEQLSALVKAQGKADLVEFLSCDGLDYDVAKGRGYGEFRLIDLVMQRSKVVQTHPGALFWKCTGRYIVKNLAEVVSTAPANVLLYCNCKNFPVDLCDLYFMAWTREGFDQLIKDVYLKLANNIDPARHQNEEILFRNYLDAVVCRRRIAFRFRRTPDVFAIRGWSNTPFSSGNSIKSWVRRIACRAAPFLWI